MRVMNRLAEALARVCRENLLAEKWLIAPSLRVGYQWLDATGTPLPGFEQPRMTIEFNRMPAEPDAVKIAYGPDSGITVHGSAITRFQYVVTNRIRDGVVETAAWQPAELPAGEYLIRITALDYSGNAATANRDLRILLR